MRKKLNAEIAIEQVPYPAVDVHDDSKVQDIKIVSLLHLGAITPMKSHEPVRFYAVENKNGDGNKELSFMTTL